MSTPIKDGGPAFPPAFCIGVPMRRTEKPTSSAMTLRDWFAGQALAGLSAQPVYATEDSAKLAQWSYQQADAMLAAREAKP